MNIYHFTHLLCYQLFMIQNTCCIICQTQNDLMLKTPTRKIKICSEIQRERLVVLCGMGGRVCAFWFYDAHLFLFLIKKNFFIVDKMVLI